MGFVIVIVHGHAFLAGYKIGMLSRITLTAAIYQKVMNYKLNSNMDQSMGFDSQILSLSQVTIGKLSIGHIVNLASNDVQRFDLVSFPLCL